MQIWNNGDCYLIYYNNDTLIGVAYKRLKFTFQCLGETRKPGCHYYGNDFLGRFTLSFIIHAIIYLCTYLFLCLLTYILKSALVFIFNDS